MWCPIPEQRPGKKPIMISYDPPQTSIVDKLDN